MAEREVKVNVTISPRMQEAALRAVSGRLQGEIKAATSRMIAGMTQAGRISPRMIAGMSQKISTDKEMRQAAQQAARQAAEEARAEARILKAVARNAAVEKAAEARILKASERKEKSDKRAEDAAESRILKAAQRNESERARERIRLEREFRRVKAYAERDDAMVRRAREQAEAREQAKKERFMGGIRSIGGFGAAAFAGGAGLMAGTVAAASPDMASTLTGSFRLLAGEIGIAFIPAMLQVSSVVQRLAVWFRNLDDSTKGAIAGFVVWGTVIGGTVMIISRVVTALSALRVALLAIGITPLGAILGIGGLVLGGMAAHNIATGNVGPDWMQQFHEERQRAREQGGSPREWPEIFREQLQRREAGDDQRRMFAPLMNLNFQSQQMSVENLHDFIQQQAVRSPLEQELFSQQMRALNVTLQELIQHFGSLEGALAAFHNFARNNPGAIGP